MLRRKRAPSLVARYTSDATHRDASSVRKCVAFGAESPIPVAIAMYAARHAGHFGKSNKMALGTIHPSISLAVAISLEEILKFDRVDSEWLASGLKTSGLRANGLQVNSEWQQPRVFTFTPPLSNASRSSLSGASTARSGQRRIRRRTDRDGEPRPSKRPVPLRHVPSA